MNEDHFTKKAAFTVTYHSHVCMLSSNTIIHSKDKFINLRNLTKTNLSVQIEWLVATSFSEDLGLELELLFYLGSPYPKATMKAPSNKSTL